MARPASPPPAISARFVATKTGAPLALGLGVKTIFDTVNQLEGAMTFHRERQTLLSGNLANLDTPGYRPLDMERATPALGARDGGGVTMARTNEGHIGGNAAPGLEGAHVFEDGVAPGEDGNAVNMERELAKIDANRLRYTTTSELVSRRLALLRYAASDGAG